MRSRTREEQHSESKYCVLCDQTRVEYDIDGDNATCPVCGNTLFDSYDEYYNTMVLFLGSHAGMTRGEVTGFLTEHGNPSKQQAKTLLKT